MNTPDALYLRCIQTPDGHDFVVGDVYPAWKDRHGGLRIALDKSNYVTCDKDHGRWIKKHFEAASLQDFEASVKRAMDSLGSIRQEHADFRTELAGVSMAALGAGEAEAPAAATEASTALAKINPAGQLRNKAQGLKRRAAGLATAVEERKAALERKLGQQMALAMASLRDVEELVEKLQEVVFTVNLYLGRDEEVVCLRDGEPAPADTLLHVRQNVLYMDEEVALVHHSIDCTEIEKFDEWLLANPENLNQVMPERKGVVVLEVRRHDKKYAGESLADILEAVAKNQANHMSYWLIRNGDRLHRIHANIFVGQNLIPREDELDHFFYARQFGAKSGDAPELLRPGSRAYLEAMEEADAVRRHFMRLALVLQGLIDRTMLFAPYKGGVKPNLLDPNSTDGVVKFIRDVDGTLTDGRPAFRDWLRGINEGMEHGHRIVGKFDTFFREREESPIRPAHATGVNDEPVHTVIESKGKFHFSFTRTDTVYRRGSYYSRPEFREAKTPGTYEFSRSDECFICIDAGATLEEMEYYLNDRRHRHAYESMVPCLQAAIAFRKQEIATEAPFRELLQRKLTEAAPARECTPEDVDRLVHWWKTKVRIHRALVSDDKKAYGMILSRYVAIAGKPASAGDEGAIRAIAQAAPSAIFAFYRGSGEFGILHRIDNEPYFLREETYKVRGGRARLVSTEPFVLAQKADYAIFRNLWSTPTWAERPASFIPSQHLSPAHYPAVLEFAKAIELDKEDGELLAAVYVTRHRRGTSVTVASFDLTPARGWNGRRPFPKNFLTRAISPDGHERGIAWSGRGTPVFRKYTRYSCATFILSGEKMTLGWKQDSAIVLFEDTGVLAQVAKFCAKVKRHNRQVDAMEDWIGEACESAKSALENAWRDRQQTKYLAEGGEMEFFDDHLKTLKKDLPDTDSLRRLLRCAVLRGYHPGDLVGMTFEQMIAAVAEAKPSRKSELPHDDEDDDVRAPEMDADFVQQLGATKWLLPRPSKAKSDEDS